ncbi:MAG: tRNA (adenosine(37)-N6)-threonylcarbamoyltransferase complex ATPase subunit type 1 TsaE [Christensenellales bacterium]|jgi:tRNA threonylcarbamoyladenosine biosynthesis protein TsaE
MTDKVMLSSSAEQTRALGAMLAQSLLSGDVILLSGDLGAGKSEFARGIAFGLGVQGPVTSPTFTLLNIHQTKHGFPLYHFDWYRIQDAEELLLAGLDEFIGGEGITLIEWHERAKELVPSRNLEITIRPLDEYNREFILRPAGGFRTLVFNGLPREWKL